MADYDDRPISVYDNLTTATTTTPTPAAAATATTTTIIPTMHTSTPKVKPAISAAATTTKATITNGTRSPYDEIAFKFNDNNKNQQQQHQSLLPNGQRNTQQQQQPMQSQVLQQQQHQHQPIAALYSTPLKPTTAALTTTTAATAFIPTTTANINSSVQRPLSQHSQSELNEASQSIAAVKAALHDAKSKFFGLNGYAPDTPYAIESQNQNLNLLHQNNDRPKVQILPTQLPLPPQTKPQPKYQNIPENSAIYRQQQQQQQQPAITPPILPPKPTERQKSNSPDIANRLISTPSPASSSPSPLSIERNIPYEHRSPQASDNLSISTSPSQSAASASMAASMPYQQQQYGKQQPQQPQQLQQQHLPHATAYKQLPLNDIDGPQPSQAVYMSTTVPQNIKGSKIAGRHTPTRNSLRHSRMLVVNNKNYQGIQHPNPMNFKYPNLARGLLILKTLIGVLIIMLAVWIFFLAPNTAIQDNPYWSGLVLLLAGIIGLVLVRYQRIKRHKVRENCFLFLRADSYLLALAAVLLCVVALICATIHFARITASDTRCISSNMLLEHGSCACTFNALPLASNNTENISGDLSALLDEDPDEIVNRSYTVEYRDLSCQEVKGEWTMLLGASIALNGLGFIIALLYIIMLASCRQDIKRIYTSVHTSTF